LAKTDSFADPDGEISSAPMRSFSKILGGGLNGAKRRRRLERCVTQNVKLRVKPAFYAANDTFTYPKTGSSP
jgi:hypothetical protein